MSLAEQGLVDERGEAAAKTLDWLLAIDGAVAEVEEEKAREAKRGR